MSLKYVMSSKCLKALQLTLFQLCSYSTNFFWDHLKKACGYCYDVHQHSISGHLFWETFPLIYYFPVLKMTHVFKWEKVYEFLKNVLPSSCCAPTLISDNPEWSVFSWDDRLWLELISVKFCYLYFKSFRLTMIVIFSSLNYKPLTFGPT